MAVNINGIYTGELKPSVNVAGCVEIFENAFPNPKETIQMIEQQCHQPESGVYWERATTLGSGVHQDLRTNYMLGLSYHAEMSDNPVLQNIHNQFRLLLFSASIPYAKRYKIDESLDHEPYSILKYSAGEEYKAHYDGNMGSGRTISAITYLNDDYEGGELEFPYHNIKIKPQAGMLVLFPSSFPYAHIAHPVTKGTKYAIVTWITELK